MKSVAGFSQLGGVAYVLSRMSPTLSDVNNLVVHVSDPNQLFYFYVEPFPLDGDVKQNIIYARF